MLDDGDHKISSSSIQLLRSRFLPNKRINSLFQKTVFAMAGIPGSGKTTFVSKCLNDGSFPYDAFILNCDSVMETLPEYISDYEQFGQKISFNRWEIPARNLSYRLLEEAVALNLDIIKDMNCVRWENFAMLERLKEQHGYYLKMYLFDIDPEIALRRIKDRKRYTPPAMVLERAIALKELKDHYKSLVHEYFEFNS